MRTTAEDIITAKLMEYLQRRSAPQQIRGKADLEREEMKGLLRIVMKYDPRGDLEDWWDRLTDELGALGDTWAWPLPKHLHKAAEAASRYARTEPASTWVPDPVRINAKRMSAGEPVSEFWLYGEYAMMLEDLVDQDTFDRYRSAAYLKRVHVRRDGTKNTADADAWEQAQRRIHESAKQRAGQTTGQQPDVSRLVKTFGAGKETPSGSENENRAGFMTPDEIAAEDARRAV